MSSNSNPFYKYNVIILKNIISVFSFGLPFLFGVLFFCLSNASMFPRRLRFDLFPTNLMQLVSFISINQKFKKLQDAHIICNDQPSRLQQSDQNK
jgi:hypothetical protein